MEGEPPQVNYARRTIGAVICLAPVVLLLASVVVGLAHSRESGLGVGLSIVGLLLGCLNLYLVIIRPVLHVWRHGSTEGLRHISGVPLLGTLLVVAGGILGFGDWRSAAVGMVAVAIDFDGLPWLLVATWRDRSFWDE